MHEALPVRRRPQLARMQATNAASRSRHFIFFLPKASRTARQRRLGVFG
jgi:hypothetical protein